jgi:hypothetical protein
MTGNRIIILAATIMLLFAGCSGLNQTTVSLAPAIDDISAFQPSVNASQENQALLGTWILQADLDSRDFNILENRESAYHLNVSHLIPAPLIQIVSIDILTGIVNIDVTLSNPSPYDAYDIRLIVYTNDGNIRLMNPDNWTALYDIPGGWAINPFKAFCTTEQKRKFPAHSQRTARIQLDFPENQGTVAFAVDASFPGNCEEPYRISDFTHTPLHFLPGSDARASVKVYDWQNDLYSVQLYCPSVTGTPSVLFNQAPGPAWETIIVNETGAQPGKYTGVIIANSQNSGTLALYDIVSIEVSSEQVPLYPEIIKEIDDSFGTIELSENKLFTSAYEGMAVYDLTDPINPVFEGETEHVGAQIKSIKFENDMVYMTAGQFYGTPSNAALKIANIQYPTAPEIVGSIEMYRPLEVDVDGNLAVVADSSQGLKVVDVYDSANPILLSTLEIGDAVNQLVFEDFYAYAGVDPFGTTSGNFFGIYLLDPANPIITTEMRLGDLIADIEKQDNKLYVTTGNYGDTYSLRILNISDPDNPVFLGEYNSDLYLYVLTVQGDYAYIITDSKTLIILDISDPQDIYKISEVVRQDYIFDVAVKDQYAYLVTDPGLVILRLW